MGDQDDELFTYQDGMTVIHVEDGDGSLPRFVHLSVTNTDAKPPNAVTVALDCAEAYRFGAWIMQYAERAAATDPRAQGGGDDE